MKRILLPIFVLAILILPLGVLAQEVGFVPITEIETFKAAGNAETLPDFLNYIYKICIGLAAVIGVLQIMRAGITWMTAGGSHEKIGEARGLIRDTLFGLLLVLAPTIVFGIINPDILDLRIGNLNKLAPSSGVGGGGNGSTTPNGGSAGGNNNGNTTNPAQCPASYSSWRKAAIGAGQACNAGNGYQEIPAACCGTASGVCCGNQYSPSNPPPSMIPATIGDPVPQPNPACTTRYPNNSVLTTQDQETCCSYQDAYGISCEVGDNNRGPADYKLLCKCTAN